MTPIANVPSPMVNDDADSMNPLPDRTEVPRLPGIATQVIGERMRAMYGELVREPVPSDLIDLIQKLEQKERAR